MLLLTKYADDHGILFKLLGKGLYASDCLSAALNFFGVRTAQDWTHINTVEDQKSEYTKHEYRDAILMQKIQNIMMYPSVCRFTKIMDSQLIANLPVGCADITAAERIFGPNLGALKGKTPKHRSVPVSGATGGVLPRILE